MDKQIEKKILKEALDSVDLDFSKYPLTLKEHLRRKFEKAIQRTWEETQKEEISNYKRGFADATTNQIEISKEILEKEKASWEVMFKRYKRALEERKQEELKRVERLKYMLCDDCGKIPTADIIDKVSKIFRDKK